MQRRLVNSQRHTHTRTYTQSGGKIEREDKKKTPWWKSLPSVDSKRLSDLTVRLISVPFFFVSSLGSLLDSPFDVLPNRGLISRLECFILYVPFMLFRWLDSERNCPKGAYSCENENKVCPTKTHRTSWNQGLRHCAVANTKRPLGHPPRDRGVRLVCIAGSSYL